MGTSRSGFCAALMCVGLAVGCGSGSGDGGDCPASQLLCDDLCIDPRNNNVNCGSCGNVCEGGEVCGDGVCQTNCPAGQMECDETCFDTENDPLNCGGCGIECDDLTEECRSGSCEIACSRLLNSAVEDPWGYSWDGNERPLSPQADAEATCAAIGGRLPHANELFRVSANETGVVGQTSDTNRLWTSSRAADTRAVRLRLSDGATDDDSVDNDNYFRCVCPPEEPAGFVGDACYGDFGAECLSLDIMGGLYNFDGRDRPALTKREAMEDCQLSGATLATSAQYAAAIAAGAVGSNTYVHVNDDARSDLYVVLRWDGDQSTTWVSSGNMSNSNQATRRPYRCIGLNVQSGTHPNMIPGEFVGRDGMTGLKGEVADAAATTWAGAHDVCYARGGHLPTSGEMAELIMHGLPGGSGVSLWTADQAGFDTVTFRATMVTWTGTDDNWFYNNGQGDVQWSRQSNSHPHRCVYYPLDTAYAGPAAADCSGGCTEYTLTGGAKIWFDTIDRASVTADEAYRDCASVGGLIPSERDFTEAIRGALPNGTTTFLWTSDYARGNTGGLNAYQKVVQWTGVEPDFTDLYAAYQTWSALTGTRPYRCMWTNELR